MPDPRFHPVGAGMRLAEAADLLGAELVRGGDPDRCIRSVAPLTLAGPDEVAFLEARRHLDAAAACRAGAWLVTPELAEALDPARNLLIVADPKAAHARLSRALHPEPGPAPGIDPSALVHPAAVLGDGVSVGAGAVLGAGAEIGAGSSIGAGSVIGPGVVMGEACSIGPQVTITHAILGARVRVLPGARIGQAGFGFVPGATGLEPVPQLGRVLIGDDVDVGANTCIDRGAGDDTVIGPGTKIDNLVQIAHNCRIGAHCVIVSQVGLSGSITVGDGAMLGGQVGVADHVVIGAGARLAAKAGVMRDVPPGATHGGIPAQDIRGWHKDTALLRRMRNRGGRDKA